MVLEDFDTYIEVDPTGAGAGAGRLQWTTHHIDHKSYTSEDCYLYKDKGVDHFGDFVHYVDTYIDAFSHTSYCYGFPWALTNEVDDIYGLCTGNKTEIFIHNLVLTASDVQIWLREAHAGTFYEDRWAGALIDTWYYLRIEKLGICLRCRIWTNAADRDNNDIGAASYKTELSIILHADHKFRYIFPANTYNTGTGHTLTIDVENLDLREVVVKCPIILFF